MARKPRVLFAGAMYHVTFRGNAQQDIFLDTRDRRRMLERLALSAERHQVSVLLYCLMSNHVHLLVQTTLPNLDRFMGNLLTSYSLFFNKKYGRVGHVTQGRYAAKLVSGDTYLLNLSRYIHLNPVETSYWEDRPLEERIHFLRRFIWSSFPSYSGEKSGESWLNKTPILSMIPAAGVPEHQAYRDFVERGLVTRDDQLASMIESNGVAIGPDEFVDDIKRRYAEACSSRIKREDAALRRERAFMPPDKLLDLLTELEGFDSSRFRNRRQGRRERTLTAMALQKHSGLTQREIAPYLDLSTGAAVSILIDKNHTDPMITNWMKSLDASIGVSP